MSEDKAWNAALQVEEWAGELRVNLIRAASIAAFYGQHLFNYYVMKDPFEASYHLAVTAISIAWVTVGVALHVCLSRRYRPSWLSYGATGADLFLVTILLMVSDGPKSSLLVLYLLVVATTAVRLDLSLVRATTLMAAVGYGAIIVHSYEYREAWIVSRHHQVIFTLAIGCAGLLAGQSVRRAKRLAKDYHDRLEFLARNQGASEGAKA